MMSKHGMQQGKIVVFIKGYHDEHGYAPSYREIAAYLGLKSTSTVHHHIYSLIEDGRLATDLPEIHSRAYRVASFIPRKK